MNDQVERRHTRRVERNERVQFRVIADSAGGAEWDEPVPCNTTSYSAEGFCLRLEQAVNVGSQVEICAKVPQNPLSYFLKGEVVHCENAPDGNGYLVGVQLQGGPGADIQGWRELF